MRIDALTIFPAYLDPLRLSLVGKAREAGVLDIQVHDLRGWATGRHRPVDDTPYGGGPGMVMLPEPWGAAIDAVVALDDRPATLIITTPSGERFNQGAAERLAGLDRVIIACGRYEGIDQRVADHFSTRMPVEEVSLGDFILNGGEAAALAIIESVVRLVPGVVGNPESLLEESHGTLGRPPADPVAPAETATAQPGLDEGLLEYPLYTRPPQWRGLGVPEVLLSGHHEQIASWRMARARERTAARRPDLLHPSQTLTLGGLDSTEVRHAVPADAGEILTLQRCCWVEEAQLNPTVPVPALQEDLSDTRQALRLWTTVVVRHDGRLVGSVRGRQVDEEWHIGRLMVAPDLRGRGLGRWLLAHAEAIAPEGVTSYTVMTGANSRRNLTMYARAGYRRVGGAEPGVVRLNKPRPGLAPTR